MRDTPSRALPRNEDLVRKVDLETDSAVEEFLREYGPLVFRIIRRRMARSARFDSADIAQAVWASFFGHREKLRQFETSEEMVQYLTGMALNKVRKVNRDNFLTQKRAVSRELPPRTDEQTRIDEPHAGGPTPSQLAIADETWERLFADLPIRQQHILHMRLEGYAQEEIAQSLGISVRTVARLLARITERVNT